MRVEEITKIEAESLVAWWREAGVDSLVGDEPFDWLAREAPVVARTATPAPPPPAALPATLDAFQAWLAAGVDLPDTRWGPRRIAPAGDPASGLMVVVDQPEPGDADQLFAGDVGRLFDRMLAAVGRDRGSVYLASLAAVRAPGGLVDPESGARLAEIMRHHIGLAAPRRVLLMGNAASRALCGMDLRDARGAIRQINTPAGKVEAVATYAPRLLFQQPAAKAEAWKDLRLFVGDFGK